MPASPILPPDVWIYVAQFVPHDDLYSMISVNSTFFHLAMDAKYHEVKLRFYKNARELKDMITLRSRAIGSVRARFGHIHYTPALTLERIRRLKEPTIAHRVRHLRVVFGMKEPEQRKFDKVGKNSRQHIRSSLQDSVRVMTDTVAYLINIMAFSVTLWHLPVQLEDLNPFFIMAGRTFGNYLRTLNLHVKPTYLPTLLATMDCFKAVELETLGISIKELCNAERNPRRLDIARLDTALAPFINKFAPILHSLTLGPWVDSNAMTLSQLFPHLENIPNLTFLRLRMKCDPTILSDPLGFTRFLRNHAPALHLFHLSMDSEKQTLSSGQWEQSVVHWLNRNRLDGVAFPNLHGLEIGVPRPAGIDLIMEFVTRSAGTLTQLMVQTFSLSYNEVKMLASSLVPHAKGLQTLSLAVTFLSPELILLLAQELPRLKSLGLRVFNVVAQNGSGDVAPTTREQELSNARKFAAAMRAYDIRHWDLQDIIIWTVDCYDSKLGWKLMREFVDWTPSVKTFGGRDKDLLRSLPVVLSVP